MTTELPSDTFARRLRAERVGRGLSQAQLARRVTAVLGTGIDPSAITRIEQSSRAVRLDEAVAMAQVLKVELSSLLSEDPETEDMRRISELSAALEEAQRVWARSGQEVSRLIREIEIARGSTPR